MTDSSPPPYTTLELVVPGRRRGVRVDQFLPAALEEQHGVSWSRRAVRRAIDAGAVWLDGRRLRVASRQLRTGQRLEVRVRDLSPPASRVPDLDPERILWHDPWLIAVDKPPGLPVQATPTDALWNVLESVRAYFRRDDQQPAGLELAHRLDRGTSGVLLLAKNRQAMASVSAAFAERRVEKRYQVLVARESGQPMADLVTISSPLVRQGRRMEVDAGGKSAATEIRLLERWPAAAWLEARPLTGRKHQIRAHLASVGWPVLGDRLYGSAAALELGAERLMLHASSLCLSHPITGDEVKIEAPLPADFQSAVERFRAAAEASD